MSSLAYFLAKDTVDYFNTIVKPLVYLSMFYFFNNPRSSVGDNYIVLICLVYCVTGIAFALAILFEPGPAQLWSVLLPVVLTLIATSTNDNKIVESISELCYTRWALEAFVVSNAQRYKGVWLITRCGSLMENGYNIKHFPRCLIFLTLTGSFTNHKGLQEERIHQLLKIMAWYAVHRTVKSISYENCFSSSFTKPSQAVALFFILKPKPIYTSICLILLLLTSFITITSLLV
ncbi:hypothetical protein YC2023_035092 [Brassica napus]